MKYFLKKNAHKSEPISIEELIKVREKIMTEIASYYSKLSGINSILLVGSRQGRPQDHYSDLDFFIFYEQEPPDIEIRKKFIASLQNKNEHIFVFDDHSYEYGVSDDFEVEGVEVCQTFYHMGAAKNQINCVFSGFYRKIGFYYPMALVAAIAEGEIIYAEDSFIKKLKDKCAFYPESLKSLVIQEELPMINYYMSRIYLAIFRNDKFYFDDLMYQATDSVLHVVFALNSTYLYSRKALKNKIDKLKYKPDHLYEHLSFLIEKTITPEIMKQKQTILHALTQQLSILVDAHKNRLTSQSEILRGGIHPCANYILDTQKMLAINV